MGVLHCQPNMNTVSGLIPSDPYYNMDHIILVGDNGRKYMDYWKCARPFSVIYNGVEKPKIKNKKPRDRVFRFIFSNGWAPHKGFAKIIPAIRMVARKHKIEVYVMGGHGRDVEPLFDEISDLPIVRLGLLSNEEKIRECYERADCALFASRTEACPFAGIEAMAYNLPIISTNESACAEMFGPAALYVEMGPNHEINASQYANQMLKIIDEAALRARLSVAGYSRFLQKYTRKQMLSETVSLYEKIISQQ